MPSFRQILRSLIRTFFPEHHQPAVEPERQPEVRTYLSEWTFEAVNARNKENYNKIMASEDAVAALKLFAHGLSDTKLVEAWEDIQGFRFAVDIDFGIAIKKARRIVQAYLDDTATAAPCIPTPNLRHIKHDVSNGLVAVDTFETAEEYVKEEVFKNVYPRFVGTPEYRLVLAKLEEAGRWIQ